MGPYELLEAVGRGGMGIVYRGRHRQTGQIVAVKVMSAEAANDPIHLRRFEQEFWAATRLLHPHIVRGLDFGVDKGQPFLVMEFVEGQNLNLRVKKQGPVPLGEALRIIIQVGSGLELAHQNKMIHRDVKPDNIILAADGRALLTDLGLIKDLDADTSLTRSRMALGTVNYMAPEQFEDAKHADGRCDVYGLGATLYFALTGLFPFQGRGTMTILSKKLKNDFVPPRQLLPALPEAVDTAICRTLDVSLEQRPQSCAEFTTALHEVWKSCPEAQENPLVLQTLAPGTATERRIASRYVSGREASCRQFQQDSRSWAAEIQDASVTGLRLHLERRFEPNTVLAVEILDEQSVITCQWFVRVRWVRELSPRKWSLGCTFSRELGEGELNTLLAGKSTSIVVHPDNPPPKG